MPAVTGQFFFTTIAGLALSVAGFATLVTALRSEGRWSRTSLWRLRNIVGESLTMAIGAAAAAIPSRTSRIRRRHVRH